MKLSDLLRRVKDHLPLSIQFLMELFSYWRRLCRYNASVDTDHDRQKMQYTLLRENHIIEKGMSMPNPRHGFGQAKVSALITRMGRYCEYFGGEHDAFLLYILSTIQAYIDYQRRDGVAIPEIESAFSQLCSKVALKPELLSTPAGIQILHRQDLQQAAVSDFQTLLLTRHSIRYFKDELPPRELLEQALTLASRTPSACNRQAWHTHIYFGEDAHELLRMQGGCNGFCDDIPCCIVVTADMKGFLGHEPFQCYIDGGLYTQNLINALHFVGLGNIPLSCGFLSDQLLNMQHRFQIPENEVMVVIVGTGLMTDEVKVAISTRKPISTTNTYHHSND